MHFRFIGEALGDDASHESPDHRVGELGLDLASASPYRDERREDDRHVAGVGPRAARPGLIGNRGGELVDGGVAKDRLDLVEGAGGTTVGPQGSPSAQFQPTNDAAASRLRMPSMRATCSIEAPACMAETPRQATIEFGQTPGSSPSPALTRLARTEAWALARALVRSPRSAQISGASAPLPSSSSIRRLSWIRPQLVKLAQPRRGLRTACDIDDARAQIQVRRAQVGQLCCASPRLRERPSSRLTRCVQAVAREGTPELDLVIGQGRNGR